MRCTNHTDVDAVFECDNPSCNRHYCLGCLKQVSDLWGVILEEAEGAFSIGLTCPSCSKTTIRIYSLLKQNQLYDSLLSLQATEYGGMDNFPLHQGGGRDLVSLVQAQAARTKKRTSEKEFHFKGEEFYLEEEELCYEDLDNEKPIPERTSPFHDFDWLDALPDEVEFENRHGFKEVRRKAADGSVANTLQKVFPHFLLSGEDFMTTASLDERKSQNSRFLEILEFDIVRHYEEQGEVPFYVKKESRKRLDFNALRARYMLDNPYFCNFVYAKRIDFMMEFFRDCWQIDFELRGFPRLQQKYTKIVYDALKSPQVSVSAEIPSEMQEAVLKFQESNPALRRILGSNKDIINLKYRIAVLAPKDVSVLITGETGTGKELVAQALHQGSGRAGEFRAVNCAAISRELFESDLFGHVRGSFSGALRDQKGQFALAAGGTLFLDEISKMPQDQQAKLLRAIETKRIRPIGSERENKVDVRIVAASNKDLKQEADEERFLPDLLYRLQTRQLNVLPLRDRKDDIPLLVDYFVNKFAQEEDMIAPVITQEYLTALQDYSFPGNIRELMSVVGVSLESCDWSELTPEHLPPEVREDQGLPDVPDVPLRQKVTDKEIIDAMEKAKGNKSAAARLLGVAVKTITRRWKEIMQSK